jgi:hypothetical protein
MKHYVYKITDIKTNEFYIGSRSCSCNPKNDSYMGSMKQWKPNDADNLIKEIIKSDFTNREDAIQYESNLISQFINDKLNRNYHIPTKGFHVAGLVKTEEQRKNISKIRIDKELAKGKNNPMYSKKHSPSSLNKMKEKAKDRYTLKWYMDKYGEEGIYLYETKNKIHSNRMSGSAHPRYGKYGIDNPMYGRIVSDDTKSKISKTKSKKILQFSIDGIFIKEWDTVKEAANNYNMHINTIYNNLMKRRSCGGGYIWEYSKND